MIRLAPLFVLAIVLGFAAVPLLRDGRPPAPPFARAGAAAPALPVADWAEKSARGLVLVNFFASWCLPCAEEQPVLARLARETGLRVYGIAYKDKPEATALFLARHGDPFTEVGYDPAGSAAIEWGVYGVPETYVLRDGKVVWRHVGVLSAAVVEKDVRPLIVGEDAP